MSDRPFRLQRLLPDDRTDLDAFRCGADAYDVWLRDSARAAVRTRSASVYLLVDAIDGRVAGYFTISPTQVSRLEVPGPERRQVMRRAPGYLIGKLALDRGLQGRPERMGRQLVLAALAQVVSASRRSGGQIVTVEAAHEGLIGFYERCGFRRSVVEGSLRLFMKVATAERYLESQ